MFEKLGGRKFVGFVISLAVVCGSAFFSKANPDIMGIVALFGLYVGANTVTAFSNKEGNP